MPVANESPEGESNTLSESEKKGWSSFWALLILQVQNAFNDKAAQFLLIPLGTWLVKVNAGVPGTAQIEYVLAAIIVLPFILFSPLAGWFSDRYSKTMVLRGAAILQLIVLIWITTAIYYEQLWVAVGGFFMLSVQSVMFSPAKRGIVKELVGHTKLGYASGLMEISVVLAICIGQIVTGIWFSSRVETSNNGWDAAFLPLIILTAASVVALLGSLRIQRVPAQGYSVFRTQLLFEHFGQLAELWKVRSMKLAAVGIAFFWGYAGYLNLAAIGIAKQVTGGGDDFGAESSWMMAAASSGIVLGGALASIVCKKRIELGLIPLGGIIMVIGSIGMGVTPIASSWIKFWLVVAGGGGAMLLVPLNAFLQDICPPEKRGKVLAAIGLLDCIAGLTAVLVQLGLVAIGVSFSYQFIGLAVVCVFATRYAAKLLPEDFLRLLVLGGFRMFYRVQVMNAERIPKEGGVLMTPNHVSYIDGFILSVACPRKIRFLMYEGYFKRKWIGSFVRVFGAVPISQTKAKDAMRTAAQALEEGAVVCIFPEGQLARTGGMNEFKRGFEMIARKAGCPVLPTAMDGLWGSIFSFERNKFIYKIPYRCPFPVTVNFGEAIDPKKAQADKVRYAVESLRAEAFARRPIFKTPTKVLTKKVKVDGEMAEEYEKLRQDMESLDHDKQVALLANAVQLGEMNAMLRGQTIMMDWNALAQGRDVVAIAFAQYFDLNVILLGHDKSKEKVAALAAKYQVDHYIGVSCLRKALAGNTSETVFYDFSQDALESESKLPCLIVDGIVIAISMPHPDAETATNQHQAGYKTKSWGRLLPGFHVEKEDAQIHLSGLATQGKRITLDGLTLDENSMLVLVEYLAEDQSDSSSDNQTEDLA
ncbi:MAG: MFS transporter [Akkermansiaceae bacterium]